MSKQWAIPVILLICLCVPVSAATFSDDFLINSSSNYGGDIGSFTWNATYSNLTSGWDYKQVAYNGSDFGAGTYHWSVTPMSNESSGYNIPYMIFGASNSTASGNPQLKGTHYGVQMLSREGNYLKTIGFEYVVEGVRTILNTTPVSNTTYYNSSHNITAVWSPADTTTVNIYYDGDLVISNTNKSLTLGYMGVGSAAGQSSWDLMEVTASDLYAGFTPDSISGEEPLLVNFTDISYGSPTAWQYLGTNVTPGNNTEIVLSTNQSPQIAFMRGFWSIKLNASTSTEYNITPGTVFVNVSAPASTVLPIPDFTSNETTCGSNPCAIQFNDTSVSNILGWNWSFGDGLNSSARNPVHTYTTAGLFDVTLEVVNVSGYNTTIKSGYINVSAAASPPIAPTAHFYMNKTYEGSPPAGGDDGIPVADFVANETTVDVGGAVSLTDLSTNTPTSWKWTVKSNTVETWNYYYTQNPVLTNVNCAGLSHTGEIMIILDATNANGTGNLTKVDYIAVIDPVDEYGAAAANVTGYPIGGGAGYTDTITTGDYIVNSKATLLSALGSAEYGDVIYVQPGTPIDLTGELPWGIPEGVTLASNRGVAGSPGATITKTEHTTGFAGNSSTTRYTSSTWEEPMFFVMGDDVRVTGLQLVGEEFGQDGGGGDPECCNSGDNWCDSGIPGPCANNYLVGIFSRSHDNLTVDNCEIYGWAWSGIQTAWTTDTYVHHNYIHDNNARSEGYGGSQYGGEVVYEANLYNDNRHSITSSGLEDETYTARYNIIIGDGDAIGASHFDVHENEDELDNTAGDVFYIHHNTFMDGDDDMASVHIRSRPATGAYIYNNLFQAVSTETDDGKPIYQTFHTDDGYTDFANFFATDNQWISTVYPDNDDIAWFQLV